MGIQAGKKHRLSGSGKPRPKPASTAAAAGGRSYTRLLLLLALTGVAVALLYNHYYTKHGQNSNEIKKEDEKTQNTQTKEDVSSKKPKTKPKHDGEYEETDDVHKFKSTVSNKFDVKTITVDGRDLKPDLLYSSDSSTVKAYVFDNFLSETECDGLLRAHIRHVGDFNKEPPIVCFDSADTANKHILDAGKGEVSVSDTDFTQGTLCLNESLSKDFGQWISRNWSYSTAFYPGESKFSDIFADRVFRATNLLPSHGGKFQITSYGPGIGYKTHTDCTIGSADKRDRFATILVYLRDVEEGGETEFPQLDVAVKPKKGQALVWTNMTPDGKCDPTSIHQAARVIRGHKFILQRWYYYKNFYSIHKRPTDADIPPRAPSVAKVSCDEYEKGSCRWYDEWNFSHIKEYLKLQHSLL